VLPTFSFILSHTSLFFLDPNVQIVLKMTNDWLYFNVEEQKGNNYVDELNWTKNEKGYEKYYF
jgi:hypothetical protein